MTVNHSEIVMILATVENLRQAVLGTVKRDRGMQPNL
jgi:hypothetical protein